MPGCQSCLVRPTCSGRLLLPKAGLFLTPDPLSCLMESSKVVRILPTPLLRSLFDKLKEFEEVVAPELMGDIHQELLMHLKYKFRWIARPFRDRQDAWVDCTDIPARVEDSTYNSHQECVAWCHAAVSGYTVDVGPGCSCHLGGQKREIVCSLWIHWGNTKRRRRRGTPGRRSSIRDKRRRRRVAAPIQDDPWESSC